MHHSLAKLANLPEETLVYCTHEYTLANLKFALTVEPSNTALISYHQEITQKRANNKSSLPTTIKLENMINPFLRCQVTEIQETARAFSQLTINNELDTFTVIRQMKNDF